MIGNLFLSVVNAAKKVPWWKVAASAAATAAAVAIGNKLVDKILSEKDLTFDEKLDRLNKVQSEGKITKEEWHKGRDALMTAYPSQR